MAHSFLPDDIISPGYSALTADCGEYACPGLESLTTLTDLFLSTGSDTKTTVEAGSLAFAVGDLCHTACTMGKKFEKGANLGVDINNMGKPEEKGPNDSSVWGNTEACLLGPIQDITQALRSAEYQKIKKQIGPLDDVSLLKFEKNPPTFLKELRKKMGLGGEIKDRWAVLEDILSSLEDLEPLLVELDSLPRGVASEGWGESGGKTVERIALARGGYIY